LHCRKFRTRSPGTLMIGTLMIRVVLCVKSE
jgi:hypothetical protein